MNRRGVFIFRRDLRTIDNLGLDLLAKHCDEIVGVFILSSKQLQSNKNPFFGNPSVQFMIESLKEIPQLLIAYGDDGTVLEEIDQKWPFAHVGFNRDYTPFAKKRDHLVENWCTAHSKTLHTAHDYNLIDLSSIKTQTGTIYSVFTPFYRTAKKYAVSSVHTKQITLRKAIPIKSSFSQLDSLYTKSSKLVVRGGRSAGIERLKQIDLKNYSKSRDSLEMCTSLLGAYIKFGCLSIREVYVVFRSVEPLLRQLYWREFYAYVVYHNPALLRSSTNFKKKVNIKWEFDRIKFERWCEGRTGYPIVDAGMRQLNTIGWMHNRARMITASFLVKHLGIDWRLGEKYFASKLVDYDPCSNNGGWQWSAGTGADAQPYFRIFNPWLQNQKHDPECVYVKRWVPELARIENTHILKWYEHFRSTQTSYPAPILEHTQARKEALKRLRY
jgi:deoxyribodipyrimidine photo-lyase